MNAKQLTTKGKNTHKCGFKREKLQAVECSHWDTLIIRITYTDFIQYYFVLTYHNTKYNHAYN